MSKIPEVLFIQHVLPEEDLHGMYNGARTKYTEIIGPEEKILPEVRFEDNDKLCKVQTVALRILALEPALLERALTEMPKEFVADILEHEFDPEQYVLHAAAQVILDEDISPGILAAQSGVDEKSISSAVNALLFAIDEFSKKPKNEKKNPNSKIQ